MFGEFNKEEGPRAEEANWEGWTPPWMEREGQDPRGWQGPRGPFGHGHRFGHRRGFGGPGGPFGPGFGWGRQGWQGPRGPFGPGFGFGPGRNWGIPEEFLALRSEAMEVARLFAIAARGAFEKKERVPQLHSFLERSRKELSDMIYGSTQQSQETSEGESKNSSDIGQA